jgi:hypothetical protein
MSKNLSPKRGKEEASGVAQGVGPEFKPQYCKKKKKKKKVLDRIFSVLKKFWLRPKPEK